MDAATLYVTLTLANGKPDTSKYDFWSLQACEESMAKLRALDRKERRWPNVSYRCEENRPYVSLDICEPWYHGQCEFVRTSTRRGCEALRWIAHMRGRKQLGRCYQDPPDQEPPMRSE